MSTAKRKWVWHFTFTGICLVIAVAALYRSTANGLEALTWGISLPAWVLPKADHEVRLGIFDPKGRFEDADTLGIEHIFLDWSNYDREGLRRRMAQAVSRRRWPLLTVEPWPKERVPAQGESLFADIQAGKFDEAIAALCRDIDAVGSPVLLRWGHEMENINGRYPWARRDVVGYVKAYRYFFDACRSRLEVANYFIWSPVGTKELFRYWPGADYVDYIGVSIYGFPEYDIKEHGRPRSFDDIFSETHERVSLFDKPVMIAELGVTGDERYQREWMRRAFRSFSKYPRLKMAVYFSSVDHPLAWGSDYSVPNWQISPAIFEQR